MGRGFNKIGIDVGYGYTKIANDEGQRIFPSKVGPAKDISFALREETGNPWDVISFDGKSFFIGDKTRHSDMTFTMRTRDWISSDMYRALLSAAVRLGLNGGEATARTLIVSGLPVSYYKDKVKAENMIKQVCSDLKIEEPHVSIIPQPFGTFCDVLFDDNGDVAEQHGSISINDIRVKRLGIVDIGYHTTFPDSNIVK